MSQLPPMSPPPPQPPQKKGISTGAIIAIIAGVLVVLAIPVIVLLVAILLPALSHARDAAQQVACANNMRVIGIALESYTLESRGVLPPSLELLVEGQFITPGGLVCPTLDADADEVMHLPLKEQAAWAARHGNYIYVPVDRRGMYDPEAILLYDPPGNHRKGINILFGDRHTEFVSTARAMELLNAQELDVSAFEAARAR